MQSMTTVKKAVQVVVVSTIVPKDMEQQSKSPSGIVKCRKHVGDVRLNMFERWVRCRRERPLPKNSRYPESCADWLTPIRIT
jgi:hypothetical protein